MGMGKWGIVKLALVLLLSVPAFGFYITSGDSSLREGGEGGGDPFPWGSPCQFQMESFEGYWAAKNSEGETDFYFNINLKLTRDNKFIIVDQMFMPELSEENSEIKLDEVLRQLYLAASGTGVFLNDGKQINAVMRTIPGEGEKSYAYWLYFHSYCDAESGNQTYILKLKNTDPNEEEIDKAYILERVQEESDEVEDILRALYQWPPRWVN